MMTKGKNDRESAIAEGSEEKINLVSAYDEHIHVYFSRYCPILKF